MEQILSKYLHAKGNLLGFPAGGTFELTPRCNFNCKMCYVHLTEEEQRARGRELTTAEWLQIGREAKDAGTLFLLLTGGEPTLRPDFPELLHQFKAMGFLVTMNSNGVPLEDKLLEFLKKDPPSRIDISLYGTSNETYQQLCGVPAYERVLRNIQSLREAGIDVKVNMSVTPANLQDMTSVYEAAKQMGVHTQSASYVFPPVRLHSDLCGRNFRLEPEEAGELQAQYDFIRYTKEQFLKRVRDIRHCASPADSPETDRCDMTGDGIQCRAGRSAFWITWDGKMLPCGQMAAPAADVLKDGFASAWEQTKTHAAAICLPLECRTCDIKHVCRACAAMCYCETGSFDRRPDYVCRMQRSYIIAMIRLWQEEYGGET